MILLIVYFILIIVTLSYNNDITNANTFINIIGLIGVIVVIALIIMIGNIIIQKRNNRIYNNQYNQLL